MSSTAIKAQFDFQTRLFNNVTEGITDGESQRRGADNVNNIKWIAGHMLDARVNMMSKMAGLAPDDSYAALFRRGTVLDLNVVYPTIDEVKQRWNEASDRISEGISKMTEDMLMAKAPFESPIFNIDDTNRGVLLFLLTHEAMHVGQLSILRKMAGKEAMSFR